MDAVRTLQKPAVGKVVQHLTGSKSAKTVDEAPGLYGKLKVTQDRATGLVLAMLGSGCIEQTYFLQSFENGERKVLPSLNRNTATAPGLFRMPESLEQFRYGRLHVA